MAEYIDREAFSEVLETAIKMQELAVKMMDVEDDPEFQMSLKVYSDILNGVKEFPAADVVEVVRCRECVYWRGENDLCKGICIDFDADGYCSEGKRKDGGQDDV